MAADERRERWEATYRKYDAFDYENLAAIGIGVADEEQRSLRGEIDRLRRAAEAIKRSESVLQTYVNDLRAELRNKESD